MIDIYIVHNNPEIIEDIWEAVYPVDPFIHILDIGSILDRSKAFKLKQEWGARQDPFCVLEEDGKVIKCFYTETGEDAIVQLINFMKLWKKK